MKNKDFDSILSTISYVDFKDIKIRSDFEQFYDDYFASNVSDTPSNYINFRRISDDRTPIWNQQKEFKKESVYTLSSCFKSDDHYPFSDFDIVDVYDFDGKLLGFYEFFKGISLPDSYWFIESSKNLIGYRKLRVGTLEINFAQAGSDGHYLIGNKAIEIVSIKQVDHSTSHDPIFMSDFVKKEGEFIPYMYDVCPDIDGIGMENHLSPKEIYMEVKAWLNISN